MLHHRLVPIAVPIAAGVAVALIPPGAAGAAQRLKSCKSPGHEIIAVRVRGTTCKVALKVIRADQQGKRADGFRCRIVSETSSSASVTCTRKRRHHTAEVLYDVSYLG
jgi:hypothetical protein